MFVEHGIILLHIILYLFFIYHLIYIYLSFMYRASFSYLVMTLSFLVYTVMYHSRQDMSYATDRHRMKWWCS